MKQIEIPIMGQAYMLACPEGSENQMVEAAQRVDAAMCKIRDAGKIRARDRIAVLAALNMAFDLIEKEQQPAAVSVAAPAQPAAPVAASVDHARMHALLQRMDAALAEDGRLL